MYLFFSIPNSDGDGVCLESGRCDFCDLILIISHADEIQLAVITTSAAMFVFQSFHDSAIFSLGLSRAAWAGCCSSVLLFFLTLLSSCCLRSMSDGRWTGGRGEETKEFFFYFGRTFCLPCLPRETDDWRVEVGMEMSECVDVRLLPLRHANNPKNARWAMVDSSHLLSPPFPVGPNDLPLARSFSSIVSHKSQGNSRYYVARSQGYIPCTKRNWNLWWHATPSRADTFPLVKWFQFSSDSRWFAYHTGMIRYHWKMIQMINYFKRNKQELISTFKE